MAWAVLPSARSLFSLSQVAAQVLAVLVQVLLVLVQRLPVLMHLLAVLVDLVQIVPDRVLVRLGLLTRVVFSSPRRHRETDDKLECQCHDR